MNASSNPTQRFLQAFWLACSADTNELGWQHTGRLTKGVGMEALQKPGRIAGLWFLGTFVFSIPAALLYGPVLNDPKYGGCSCSSGHLTSRVGR